MNPPVEKGAAVPNCSQPLNVLIICAAADEPQRDYLQRFHAAAFPDASDANHATFADEMMAEMVDWTAEEVLEKWRVCTIQTQQITAEPLPQVIEAHKPILAAMITEHLGLRVDAGVLRQAMKKVHIQILSTWGRYEELKKLEETDAEARHTEVGEILVEDQPYHLRGVRPAHPAVNDGKPTLACTVAGYRAAEGWGKPRGVISSLVDLIILSCEEEYGAPCPAACKNSIDKMISTLDELGGRRCIIIDGGEHSKAIMAAESSGRLVYVPDELYLEGLDHEHAHMFEKGLRDHHKRLYTRNFKDTTAGIYTALDGKQYLCIVANQFGSNTNANCFAKKEHTVTLVAGAFALASYATVGVHTEGLADSPFYHFLDETDTSTCHTSVP